MAKPDSVFSSRGIRIAEVRDWPLQALRKTREEVSYRSPLPAMGTKFENKSENTSSRCVAAIDFGTTHCSLAYTIDDRGAQILKLNEYHERVPTAIMLKAGHRTDRSTECSVHSFGKFAQTQYHENKRFQQSPYLYFERVKLNLQHDQKVSLSMVIKADNDNSEWFLVEVIAFILLYLKEQLEKQMSMQNISILAEEGQVRSIKMTDFEWVVTVPAIWQARGRRMITEAGKMAGLLNADNEICCLSHTQSGLINVTSAGSSPNLSIVPEPEAAALHCLNIREDGIADFCDDRSLFDLENRYIVLDIGGGTVDIAVLEVDTHLGSVDLLQPPVGSDSGGIIVNHEFAKFMQKILGEVQTSSIANLKVAFPKLLAGEDCQQLQRSLNKLIYDEFESQKEICGCTCSHHDDKCDAESIGVQIPHEIITKCGNIVIERNVEHLDDPRVQYEEGYLYINYSKVKEFFTVPWSGIEGCLKMSIHHTKDIHAIYLVGGFGGNKYIYSLIKSSLQEHFRDRKIKLLVPKMAKVAVVLGAINHKMEQLIRTRHMNRSYGIAVSVKLNPSMKYNIKCDGFDEDGNRICNDAFLTFISSGDCVVRNEVAIDSIYPDIDNQKYVQIPFYCSCELNLEYLHDHSCSDVVQPLAHKVGEIKFELPPGDILHKDQRLFQIIMDFSSPEIICTVRYQNTKIDIHTTLDLLS